MLTLNCNVWDNPAEMELRLTGNSGCSVQSLHLSFHKQKTKDTENPENGIGEWKIMLQDGNGQPNMKEIACNICQKKVWATQRPHVWAWSISHAMVLSHLLGKIREK